MDSKQHLVIVFPQDTTDKIAMGELFARVNASLRAASSTPPVPARPNITTVCALCTGDLRTLEKAIADVIDPYAQWLVVPVGKPFAAAGLSGLVQALSRGS